jgi:hypothetical protein
MNNQQKMEACLELIGLSMSIQKELENMYSNAIEQDDWDLAAAFGARMQEGGEFFCQAASAVAAMKAAEAEVIVMAIEYDDEGNFKPVHPAVYVAGDMIAERCGPQLERISELTALGNEDGDAG